MYVCMRESGVRGVGREMKLLVLRFKLILTCALISVFAFWTLWFLRFKERPGWNWLSESQSSRLKIREKNYLPKTFTHDAFISILLQYDEGKQTDATIILLLWVSRIKISRKWTVNKINQETNVSFAHLWKIR